MSFSHQDTDDTVQLKGPSGNIAEVNSSNELKVEANITASVGSTVSNDIRLYDMNASNGGIARVTAVTTTYQKVFEKSGSGYLFGFLINLESFSDADGWKMKLEVDSAQVFELDSKDITSSTVYGFRLKHEAHKILNLLNYDTNVFMWEPPLNSRLKFSSLVTISVKRNDGTKNFNAGLVSISGV